MARTRKELKPKLENEKFVVRFEHPVKKKTVKITLGGGLIAQARLVALNRIFLNEDLWLNPPSDNEFIRTEWLRHAVPPTMQASNHVRGEEVDALRIRIADLEALLKLANEDRERLGGKVKQQGRQIDELLGRKHRVGPFPALASALEVWSANYKGRDPDHTKGVNWVLAAFVNAIGAEKPVDYLEGREEFIENWLRDREISAGTRKQYRRYVLRFLKDSGVAIDGSKISNPKRHEVRRARGKIEWLEEADAARVGELLQSEYWSDFWRFQLMTGLRPTEQITLKDGDFVGNNLTLSPLKHLTLKNGPRTIQLAPEAMAIVERRLKTCAIVFPHVPDERWKHAGPEIAKGPWRTTNAFGKQYREALGALEGFPIKLDARSARRTFGSIQLRKGLSVERLAKYMGTSVEVLREHYAALLPSEIKLKKFKV